MRLKWHSFCTREFRYNLIFRTMKKLVFLLVFILLSKISYACDCEGTNPIMDFYSSVYVFEGKIVSKIYSENKLTYKITFEISKHYKKGDAPHTLEFELESESDYTGIWTSCDWSANLNEEWIVYAYMYKDRLVFSGICSNSRVLNSRGNHNPTQLREQKLLNNANSFNIEGYIYEDEIGFNYCENRTPIDSILLNGTVKDYTDHKTINNKKITILAFLIDTDGNLVSVHPLHGITKKRDSLFQLITSVENSNNISLTEFEEDAIQLMSQVKKWDVKKHKQTGVCVPYLKYKRIYYDLKTTQWSI